MTTPRTPAASNTPVHYRGNAQAIDDNVGFMIKLVHNSMNRMLDLEMAPLGLTAMQWRPIAILARGIVDTPAGLARILGVDTGAITRTLDRLEGKGLLRRARCTEDRRVVHVELTELGQEKAKAIPANIARVLNHHLRGFSSNEVAQLHHLLGRMLANGSAGGAAAPDP